MISLLLVYILYFLITELWIGELVVFPQIQVFGLTHKIRYI
jgi:hypothetical protein